MVYRIYAEKKEGFRKEASTLRNEARTVLGINRLQDVRIFRRFDVEGIDEDLFEECRWKVFAEPQLDVTSGTLSGLTGVLIDDDGFAFEDIEGNESGTKAFVFATEVMPGSFDQKADSVETCIQIMSGGERPIVRCAKVYMLYGDLMPADRDAIMNYVINPAEMRQASLEMPETFEEEVSDEEVFDEEAEAAEITRPDAVAVSEFDAVIDSVTFEDRLLEKAYKDYLAVRKSLGQNTPVTLNDIAGIPVRYLKREGRLEKLGEAGEAGTCPVMINVEVNGENEPWLLFFGGGMDDGLCEMRPAEGAAAGMADCVKEALSERAYPYAVMRLSGAADPLQYAADTLPGRLPQRKIVLGAAEGGSRSANLSGLATGMVDEIYHPGFAAKRMDVHAVMAAVPSVNIRRETVEDDDIVMVLLGSGTAELHRMQRLLTDGVAVRMIKKCGDAAPYGYEGMACVIDAENERLFKLLASGENLNCVKAGGLSQDAVEKPDAIHVDIATGIPGDWKATSLYESDRSFTAGMRKIASDLNTCSKRGLVERFDSTAGNGTVLMPFGGANQLTPAQAIAHKIPVSNGDTDGCTLMAWGYDPFISETSPYHGAYLAVVESVSKLIASGASFKDIYLSFLSRYGAPGDDEKRWGAPLASMLGVFRAQMDLGIGAAGCKGSMDGTFEGFDVPPSLISLAATTAKTDEIVSPEFKKAGHRVVLLKPFEEDDDSGSGKGLPSVDSLIKVWERASELLSSGNAVSAYAPGIGGVAEAVMKMCFGNGMGFAYEAMDLEEVFGYSYGSIILEIAEEVELTSRQMKAELLGRTTKERSITYGAERVSLVELLTLYEGRMEGVYPAVTGGKGGPVSNIEYSARSWHTPVFKRAEPKVLIPVFPGTNCEADTARAVREAGASPEIMVIKDRSADDIKRSLEAFTSAMRGTQIVMIPGGFAGSLEPDVSANFIAAFFRNAGVAEVTTELLEKKDGLICGISDGFRALLKLGLVPYGTITETDEECPVLAANSIGRHQSRIARVRVASNKSPWLRYNKVGDIYSVPVSCSQGRFTAPEEVARHLAAVGQIATQYVDNKGNAAADIRFNPAGSMMAVEGVTSPDGRVFGRMGHVERTGSGLYRNVPGNYIFGMFENAVRYFK